MPRGGSRPGAGRKPKPTHLRAIDGGADRRPRASAGDAMPSTVDDAPVIAAPQDLSPAELVVWNELAPHASAAKTLTPATLASFVHLVQAENERRELRARYSLRRSIATGEILPLLLMDSDQELAVRREVRQLQKDIKAAMKDFCIAPFGKEIATAAAEPEADPLDDFARKRG
jgi:hypothetical protein